MKKDTIWIIIGIIIAFLAIWAIVKISPKQPVRNININNKIDEVVTPDTQKENQNTKTEEQKNGVTGEIYHDPVLVKGYTWVWVKTVMNDGAIITPKKAGVFTTTFSNDGNVGGGTDCNGYFGEYKMGTDGSLEIGPFTGTLMFCEGSQEGVFTKAVGQATQFMVTDKGQMVLMLPYDSGSIIFEKK